ncbi:Chromo domain-containing protein [Pyrenophora tritici-repentis]|nr:Chromo domain-containing protein [Pyrenophora tritici-repentis]
MSYSCSRFSTATQDKFVHYVPKFTTPKPKISKRKAKSILSEPPLKPPTPLLTADSDSLDNEVPQAGAPAFYQNEPLCELGERASSIVEKKNLADVGEKNVIQDDSVSTGTSAPSTDEIFGCADDIPTSDSCSTQVTSTSPKVGERSCSPAGIPICVAKTSNCKLNPDRQGSLLAVWTAPNTSELSNPSTVDACVLQLRPDCGNEHTLSTNSTAFDVYDRAENAPESKTNSQELLRSEDESISFSEAANQKVMSELMGSRDEDIQSNNYSSGSHRRGSRALSGDEGDRYQVEKIMDHDEHDGRKRYLVKWLGWSEEDITWEPESNLDECRELLQDYWALRQDAR